MSKLESTKNKIKNFWRVLKQPSSKKALIVMLGMIGLRPELALVISELIPLTDTLIQAICGLVSGGVLVNEIARDEDKK